jgi:hypothetical protein
MKSVYWPAPPSDQGELIPAGGGDHRRVLAVLRFLDQPG